ncbi:hypothetical protein GJ496_008219 [Pomphorhynchus laevis]|nr:hypothetical protein GJ496_008219 [Pomphorhynchus laevis]
MNQVLVNFELIGAKLKYGTEQEYIDRIFDVFKFVLIEGNISDLMQLLEHITKVKNTALVQYLLYICESFVRNQQQEQQDIKVTRQPAGKAAFDKDIAEHLNVWTGVLDKFKPKSIYTFCRQLQRIVGKDPLIKMDVDALEPISVLKDKLKTYLKEKYKRDGYNNLKMLMESIKLKSSAVLIATIEDMEKSITAKRNLSETDYTLFRNQVNDELRKLSVNQLNKLYEELIRIDVARRQVYKPDIENLRNYQSRAVTAAAMKKGCYPLLDDLQYLKITSLIKRMLLDKVKNLMQYGSDKATLKMDMAEFEMVIHECSHRMLSACQNKQIQQAIERCIFYGYTSEQELEDFNDPKSILKSILVAKCFEYSSTLMREPDLIPEYVHDLVIALTGGVEDDELMWTTIINTIRKTLQAKPQKLNKVIKQMMQLTSRDQQERQQINSMMSQSNSKKLQLIDNSLAHAKEHNNLIVLKNILKGSEVKLPAIAVRWLDRRKLSAMGSFVRTVSVGEIRSSKSSISDIDSPDKIDEEIRPPQHIDESRFKFPFSHETSRSAGTESSRQIVVKARSKKVLPQTEGDSTPSYYIRTKVDKVHHQDYNVDADLDKQFLNQQKIIFSGILKDSSTELPTSKIQQARIKERMITTPINRFGALPTIVTRDGEDFLKSEAASGEHNKVLMAIKQNVEQSLAKSRQKPVDVSKRKHKQTDPTLIQQRPTQLLLRESIVSQLVSKTGLETIDQFESLDSLRQKQKTVRSFEDKTTTDFSTSVVETDEDLQSERAIPEEYQQLTTRRSLLNIDKADKLGVPIRTMPSKDISTPIVEIAEPVEVFEDELDLYLSDIKKRKAKHTTTSSQIILSKRDELAGPNDALWDSKRAKRASMHGSLFMQLTVDLLELVIILKSHLGDSKLYEEFDQNTRQTIKGIPEDMPLDQWFTNSDITYEIPLYVLSDIKENSTHVKVTSDLEFLIQRTIDENKASENYIGNQLNVQTLNGEIEQLCSGFAKTFSTKETKVLFGYIKLDEDEESTIISTHHSNTDEPASLAVPEDNTQSENLTKIHQDKNEEELNRRYLNNYLINHITYGDIYKDITYLQSKYKCTLFGKLLHQLALREQEFIAFYKHSFNDVKEMNSTRKEYRRLNDVTK